MILIYVFFPFGTLVVCAWQVIALAAVWRQVAARAIHRQSRMARSHDITFAATLKTREDDVAI